MLNIYLYKAAPFWGSFSFTMAKAMMSGVQTLVLILVGITFLHCSDHNKDTAVIELTIAHARNTHLYLVKRGYFREKDVVADSTLVQNSSEPVIFHIPMEKDRLYYIKVKESGRRFDFIADGPRIRIKANNLNGQYEIAGSGANISLKKFTVNQTATAALARELHKKLDSLQQYNPSSNQTDSLHKVVDSLFALINQSYINYADTVQNPAAFMAVYNLIEFGKDHKALKQLVEHNAARFSKYNVIQELKQQVRDMVDILETELNPGDTIPALRLPDNKGEFFSIASLKGKYYLIDFWSTWCNNCVIYNQLKREAVRQFPASKFALVSVAIDDNEDDWIKQIQANQLNWIQLIDKNMWTGVAAKAMKFDSIPFNFLVSPAGTILEKGITADSLLPVLHQHIK